MNWITEGTVCFLLFRLCREDAACLQISGKWLLLPPALGLLLCGAGRPPAESLFPLLPGLMLTCMSWLSRGAIGEGDALLFWSLGYLLSLEDLYVLAFLSFLMTALYGAATGFLNRGKCQGSPGEWREKRLPLLPAVLAAYLLILGNGK